MITTFINWWSYLIGNTILIFKAKASTALTGEGCIILPSEKQPCVAGLGDNSHHEWLTCYSHRKKGINDEEYLGNCVRLLIIGYFSVKSRLTKLSLGIIPDELQQTPNDMILARALWPTRYSVPFASNQQQRRALGGNHLDIDKLDQFYELTLSRRVHIDQLAKFLLFWVSANSRAPLKIE